MGRRLPPLNALRAFEAAARHLSFIKAADELAVTPGAVSQQVKSLEDQVGCALFRRLPRGVLLTDQGQRYSRRLTEIFDQLANATEEMRREVGPGTLTVSTMPSFAARWLIPRLGAFYQAAPGIGVRVLADTQMTDFSQGDVDVAIRYGGGKYAGLRSNLLFAEEVFPVCSPALMTGPHPLKTLADLKYHTLLHDEPNPGLHDLSWRFWLHAHAVTDIDTSRGPTFTFTHMSLQAAAAGQGVALATTAFIGDDLETGRLVRPFPDVFRSSYNYWLVYPEAAADRPKILAFRNWVLEEATRFIATQGAPAISPERAER
jgi:LysR family glycine cleavage system transcriptional activator